MGYTHYWRRPKTLDPKQFKLFSKDCQRIFDYCQNEMGLKLAGGLGEGEPEATEESVWFKWFRSTAFRGLDNIRANFNSLAICYSLNHY